MLHLGRFFPKFSWTNFLFRYIDSATHMINEVFLKFYDYFLFLEAHFLSFLNVLVMCHSSLSLHNFRSLLISLSLWSLILFLCLAIPIPDWHLWGSDFAYLLFLWVSGQHGWLFFIRNLSLVNLNLCTHWGASRCFCPERLYVHSCFCGTTIQN